MSFIFLSNTTTYQLTHISLCVIEFIGRTMPLHISAHGAIFKRYINKPYTIELCILYGSVGTSHNTTDNPYSFNQAILLLQSDNSYSFGQTIQAVVTPSVRQFLFPKPYGKAQIFIHYQPADQRSQSIAKSPTGSRAA
jgi:hypothetical protein